MVVKNTKQSSKRSMNRSLVYLRRSTKKQHTSLETQLHWAVKQAREDGFILDATHEDLAYMQASGLHSYKAIRLDDGISGFDEDRPGRISLNRDAKSDRSISRVYIHKRDRYSRPEDAMEACQLEKQLLFTGITVVFSDAISLPMRKGGNNNARNFELLLAYSQNGDELRKLSERIITAQRQLATAGYRTGGNAPYGHGRALVNAQGVILEELPRGKTVRQEGCHVVWILNDRTKIGIWIQILEWKMIGMGFKWIARSLNQMDIPSPDAGRTRTDHGVKHRVSGKWNATTVADLCRNATILGVLEYGKRSEGMIRRIGLEGPRLLDDDQDYCENGNLRVIRNDPSMWTVAKVGEPLFDPTKWHAIQAQMAERGKNQRGIAKPKDAKRYPLSRRLIDLTDKCGSYLHARTNHNRAVYTCGRYMNLGRDGCKSNQIDAEAMLRFTVKTLKQLIDMNGGEEKLRCKLMERALRDSVLPDRNHKELELKRLQSHRTLLLDEQELNERKMAREADEVIYVVLKRQYKTNVGEIAKIDLAIQTLKEEIASEKTESPQSKVELALSVIKDAERILSDPKARAEIAPLLNRLGVKMGLNFVTTIKGNKREVQRLNSGRIVFGNTPLPVPLFGKDNIEGNRCCKEEGANALDSRTFHMHKAVNLKGGVVTKDNRRLSPDQHNQSLEGTSNDTSFLTSQEPQNQPESISVSKENRGERI